ncbi:condensation domain-containing protein, partial [Micrococcus luteus]|uniref:condensation domain-containing protein n=3 Tax=Actinomycetes TaxID=1760 RepID=UPI00366CB654
PLSFAQRRLWFIHQLEGPSATYNVPLVSRLTGELDVRALGAALRDVVTRHESLRTVFPSTDGVPEQRVLPAADADFDLDVFDATDWPEERLTDAVAACGRHVFDLARDVPVRATLLSVSDTEHRLVLVMHHIAVDGWSLAPLLRDLWAAYRARTAGAAPAWPPPTVQYADYTLWQHELLGDEADGDSVLRQQMRHWEKALDDLPSRLELPTDRPYPAVAGERGGRVDIELPAEFHELVQRVARERNATTFMVMSGALSVLLSRL